MLLCWAKAALIARDVIGFFRKLLHYLLRLEVLVFLQPWGECLVRPNGAMETLQKPKEGLKIQAAVLLS